MGSYWFLWLAALVPKLTILKSGMKAQVSLEETSIEEYDLISDSNLFIASREPKRGSKLIFFWLRGNHGLMALLNMLLIFAMHSYKFTQWTPKRINYQSWNYDHDIWHCTRNWTQNLFHHVSANLLGHNNACDEHVERTTE